MKVKQQEPMKTGPKEWAALERLCSRLPVAPSQAHALRSLELKGLATQDAHSRWVATADGIDHWKREEKKPKQTLAAKGGWSKVWTPQKRHYGFVPMMFPWAEGPRSSLAAKGGWERKSVAAPQVRRGRSEAKPPWR